MHDISGDHSLATATAVTMSRRQGVPIGDEPSLVSIARIGYVEIPHLEVGHFNLYANNS